MRDIKELLLPHIRKLTTYQGVDPMEVLAEQAGIAPEDVIRLNGNENPYGPSPKVMEALGNFQQYNHYPDQNQRQIREKLSDYLSVHADRIVVGNGSDELIDLLLRIFLAPGENIIIPVPTFGMYSFSAEVCGGETITISRDENFEIDVEAIKLAITNKTKMAFLASPNNPTGNIATETQIRSILETGIIVVVDEAYYEFCGETALPLLEEYSNLVVLRTFSKWAGLAGLRVGLGVMSPEIARSIMSMKPPYNVNLASEIALIVSLDDLPTLTGRIDAIVSERDRMMGLLENVPGVRPWKSQANFILCKLPQDRGQEIFEGMCRQGIFPRYFNNALLKDYMRISVGFPEETDRVIETLSDLVVG
jgi:histidinol-phosphate aminotransferase